MQRKVPLPGKIFARCIPKRLFAGLFGCMARISCQSQLISDAWRANLAMKGRFPRPRPLLGCMRRKNCHGWPPGNAPRRNLAMAGTPKMHRGYILPRQPLQECFSTTSCREGPGLPGLAAKSQRRHVARRRRPNEASANSTTHADTSKKP